MSGRRIGVTGPHGFIAGHLIERLGREPNVEVVTADRATFADPRLLREFVTGCDAIVHLAGVNRGVDEEVQRANHELADQLAEAIEATGAKPHLLYSSSTQRSRGNVYGDAKQYGESRFTELAVSHDVPVTVLVIPNVYGPGCKPFYNSVVATFCHQLAHGETPQVLTDRRVEFVGVRELIEFIWRHVSDRPYNPRIMWVPAGAQLGVSELLAKLVRFRDDFLQRHVVPDLAHPLDASLYATFLSYVDLDRHRHRPQVHADDGGSLYEIIKLANGGQVFFSTTKPGVTRGDHYHTRKVEWFCVLKGEAVIRLRRVGQREMREFHVSGESPEFISIPVFHTHHIENIGDGELLTMFWCNEIFSADDPDTFFEKVA